MQVSYIYIKARLQIDFLGTAAALSSSNQYTNARAVVVVVVFGCRGGGDDYRQVARTGRVYTPGRLLHAIDVCVCVRVAPSDESAAVCGERIGDGVDAKYAAIVANAHTAAANTVALSQTNCFGPEILVRTTGDRDYI